MDNCGTIDMEYLGITDEEIAEVDAGEAEVVSRRLISRINDIIVTIRPDGLVFNSTCIRSMKQVEYVQILIDKPTHRLFVQASNEYDKDAFRWCNYRNGKKYCKKITGRPLGTRLYKMMGWSKGYSYRIGGTPARQINSDNEFYLVFELDEDDSRLMTTRGLIAAGVTDEDLGPQAEQIHLEIELMELEKQEAKEARKAGKNKRYKQEARYSSDLPEDGFGTSKKNHKNRIEMPSLEQLELFSTMEKGVNKDD